MVAIAVLVMVTRETAARDASASPAEDRDVGRTDAAQEA